MRVLDLIAVTWIYIMSWWRLEKSLGTDTLILLYFLL